MHQSRGTSIKKHLLQIIEAPPPLHATLRDVALDKAPHSLSRASEQKLGLLSWLSC